MLRETQQDDFTLQTVYWHIGLANVVKSPKSDRDHEEYAKEFQDYCQFIIHQDVDTFLDTKQSVTMGNFVTIPSASNLGNYSINVSNNVSTNPSIVA